MRKPRTKDWCQPQTGSELKVLGRVSGKHRAVQTRKTAAEETGGGTGGGDSRAAPYHYPNHTLHPPALLFFSNLSPDVWLSPLFGQLSSHTVQRMNC